MDANVFEFLKNGPLITVMNEIDAGVVSYSEVKKFYDLTA